MTLRTDRDWVADTVRFIGGRRRGLAAGWADAGEPWWLLGLFVVAALVGLYVYIQRRRTSRAMKFANLEILVGHAQADRSIPPRALRGARRRAGVADDRLAGPQSDRKVPRNKATVMLVMDVSRSMNATDVAPSGSKRRRKRRRSSPRS